MTSKEAVLELICEAKSVNIDERRMCFLRKTIEKDLDRLEKLEKVIKFLKLNFDMSLDSKLRISDGSECVQTFITYLPENTTIDEMFKTLKEVLENDK